MPSGAVSVSVTVYWTITGGCTFGGGTVSIFLLQGGVMRYCGSLPLSASSGSQVTVTVPITLPDSNRPTTGSHTVSAYITGTMSDGTALPSWCGSYSTSSHCGS